MDQYDLLYQKYRTEMRTILPDLIASKKEYEARFASELEGMHVIALNNSHAEEGFLHCGRMKSRIATCLYTGIMPKTRRQCSDCFMSDSLELIGAFENGRLAGIMEWNTENVL